MLIAVLTGDPKFAKAVLIVQENHAFILPDDLTSGQVRHTKRNPTEIAIAPTGHSSENFADTAAMLPVQARPQDMTTPPDVRFC